MTYLPAQKSLARHVPVALDHATVIKPASMRAAENYSLPDGSPTSEASLRDLVRARRFASLNLDLTEEDRAFWCFMKPEGRPSFTRRLLEDLAGMQDLIAELFAHPVAGNAAPFDYFVLGSHSPGVFNLGGDLPLFVDCIRRGDRDTLRQYAHACVETGYANYTGYGRGVMTIALLQGDALGGGLESALSCDMLIAERQVKIGLPEVVFNLFPGMGAYTYLSRRIGSANAEKLIMSGRMYTAEEMLALGVIDMVVDPGTGEQAVREHIARARPKQLAQSAIYQVRRRVNQISIEELRDVTDLWVKTALRLPEHDLNKMCRIAAAQDRFRARQVTQRPSVAAEHQA